MAGRRCGPAARGRPRRHGLAALTCGGANSGAKSVEHRRHGLNVPVRERANHDREAVREVKSPCFHGQLEKLTLEGWKSQPSVAEWAYE